jgi:hypothetical protein
VKTLKFKYIYKLPRITKYYYSNTNNINLVFLQLHYDKLGNVVGNQVYEQLKFPLLQELDNDNRIILKGTAYRIILKGTA